MTLLLISTCLLIHTKMPTTMSTADIEHRFHRNNFKIQSMPETIATSDLMSYVKGLIKNCHAWYFWHGTHYRPHSWLMWSELSPQPVGYTLRICPSEMICWSILAHIICLPKPAPNHHSSAWMKNPILLQGYFDDPQLRVFTNWRHSMLHCEVPH